MLNLELVGRLYSINCYREQQCAMKGLLYTVMGPNGLFR
jgi:hypothetical protein